MESYHVHAQCQAAWNERYAPPQGQGEICICGHPMFAHDGMCTIGTDLCTCMQPEAFIQVSDTRHFFRFTKGPHEAHALSLGIQNLLNAGGQATITKPWLCSVKGCERQSGVLPVRMRSGNIPTLKVSVADLNRLLCDSCLQKKLMS